MRLMGYAKALLLVALLPLVAPFEQQRILAVPLLPTSPTMDLMAVAVQLKARGHEVLVIAAAAHMQFFKQAAARHSSNSSAESLQYVAVDVTVADPNAAKHKRGPAKPAQVTQSRFAVPHLPRSLTAGMDLELVIQDVVAEPCAALLENSTIRQLMLDFKPHAVMAIGVPVPDTAADSCGCLLSHALGVPFIDVDCGMTFWSGPPSTPQFGTLMTPKDLSTVPGALQTFATWLIKQTMRPIRSGLLPTPWSTARDRLGLPRAATGCPVVDGVVSWVLRRRVQQCDVLLNAIMGRWLLEHPRPLAPYQVLLGAGTPRPPHAIKEQEVAEFVQGAADGLVLVAFGTSFQFNSWLSLTDYQELSAAFASLEPARVLWHINTQALPKGITSDALHLGGNTMLVPLVDYNDVLGHPNTRAFVSHCGLHSVYEAAYHGVPVVGVPFMFEQAESGLKLALTGAAVMCEQAPAYRTGPAAQVHYTRQHVAGLIQKVLTNASYSQAAQGLSVVLQTQAKRRHPYAAAADEVELALNARRVYCKQVQHADEHSLLCGAERWQRAAEGTQAGPVAGLHGAQSEQEQHSEL